MATLTTYRRALAPLLGPYYQGTAGTSTTSALVCTGWPFMSTLSQDDLFTDLFVFRPAAAAAADKARVVASYTPSSGTLTPDGTWTNAPTGEVFELHGAAPPVGDGTTDLHALLNEALKEIPLAVEFTFTTASNQAQRHSLASAASWLTEDTWVYQVGYLTASESRANVDPFRGRRLRARAHKEGGTVYLEGFSVSTADTVYVLALKPAYSHCKASGGTFGDQSGLSAETDEAVPETEWVVAAARAKVWERLGTVLSPGDAGRARDEYGKAIADFRGLTAKYWQAPERTLRPVVAWGGGRVARC